MGMGIGMRDEEYIFKYATTAEMLLVLLLGDVLKFLITASF